MGRGSQLEAFKRDNAVVDIIFQHKGKNNAIGTRELVRALNEKGFNVTAEQVHTIVNNIVYERKLPICAVTKCGYYWAVTKQDIQLAIDELQSKINGLQDRVDFLKSFIFE